MRTRYLKTYKVFEAVKTGLTSEQEAFLNMYTKGSWTYDPATGLVDVNGDFEYSDKRAKTLSGIKFGKVVGNFDCLGNKLTTLEGAPQEVGGYFDCRENNLTSLEGAPQVVGGKFDCSYNNLTSLEGAPQEVGGDFNCKRNKLKSLVGAPKKVGGSFDCWKNNLTSLEGAPQKVGGEFDCRENNLTSLEGAPQKVGGGFYCWKNELTSLKGAPQEVGVDFGCDAFRLEKGQWNLKGWLKLLKEGSPKAQKLILPFLTPEVLNKEIQQDPAGMVMKLKEVWNDEIFRETRDQLVFPKGYEKEADLVGDLEDVGF